MVTRLWCGRTAREDADAYERLLLLELFPSIRGIPGFRDEDGEVAFVTLTRLTAWRRSAPSPVSTTKDR
jgi:hypothetical protein